MRAYKYHLGIDFHRRTSFWTLMDNERNIVYRKNLPTSEAGIEEGLREIKISPSLIQSCIEPVSGWGWYGDLLEEKGLEVHLVNPYQSKLIAASKLKNDKVDSKILAEMMRSDFLPTAYRAPKETRSLREFMRGRAFLVRMRVRMRNRIHQILCKHGIICPWTDLFGKGGQEWLNSQSFGEPYDSDLKSLILFWKKLTLHIAERDRKCADLLKASNELKILASIPGIGAITALTMLAEIGDYQRFRTPEQLASFAGLVSSSYSSGGVNRFGHITHRGSVWLRTALVESTGKVSKKWGRLYEFYTNLRARKGNKIARVALARKILVLSWHLIMSKEKFNPLGHRGSVKTGTSQLS